MPRPDFGVEEREADQSNRFQGLTESQGNAAWLITDILAHAWYFNSIAACFPLGSIAL